MVLTATFDWVKLATSRQYCWSRRRLDWTWKRRCRWKEQCFVSLQWCRTTVPFCGLRFWRYKRLLLNSCRFCLWVFFFAEKIEVFFLAFLQTSVNGCEVNFRIDAMVNDFFIIYFKSSLSYFDFDKLIIRFNSFCSISWSAYLK